MGRSRYLFGCSFWIERVGEQGVERIKKGHKEGRRVKSELMGLSRALLYFQQSLGLIHLSQISR